MIDLELEQTILGTMCQAEECLTNGMARLKEEFFHDSFHRAIFKLIAGMYEKDMHVSVVTVATEGKKLFAKNNISWLAIRESFISSASFDSLIDKLIKQYQLRKMERIAVDIADRVKKGSDPDDIIKAVESKMYTVLGDSKLNIVTPKEHAMRMLDTMGKRMDMQHNGGIYTAYGELNKALNGGFERGQLIILAAQTGKGKTAFAMNLMRDIAIRQRIPALYINTEMAEEQMDIRWMSMLGGVDHYSVATGQIDAKQQNNIMTIINSMHTGGFYSVTEPDLTMNKLISICRRFTAQKKCRFIVVDYIGRMDTLDPKLKEWEVLKLAAKKLKTLAQQLGVTMLMLAQVNEAEKLEGARSMKNECDLYGYLRPLTEKEVSAIPGFNYCLDIEKNRSGPTRKIPLIFAGEVLTFVGRDMVALDKRKQESEKDMASHGNQGQSVAHGA